MAGGIDRIKDRERVLMQTSFWRRGLALVVANLHFCSSNVLTFVA